MRRPAIVSSCIVVVALSAALAGCSGGNEARPSNSLQVVVTTTILGDIVANVVGDDAVVDVLLPIGVNPHEFVPSAQQVAQMHNADLVVANGLGLEAAMEDILRSVEGDGGNMLEIAPLLDPIPFGDGTDDLDPHLWVDPLRVAMASELIATELARLDSTRRWLDRATTYSEELASAHKEIVSVLSGVEDADRKLVTNHDSLGYFAKLYGFEVLGTVIPGGTTGSEPSSASLAELVTAINRNEVPAIFAETTEPAALAEAVAAETGSDVAVVELFSGSLGEAGSDAETLVEMLMTNARRIAEALS